MFMILEVFQNLIKIWNLDFFSIFLLIITKNTLPLGHCIHNFVTFYAILRKLNCYVLYKLGALCKWRKKVSKDLSKAVYLY